LDPSRITGDPFLNSQRDQLVGLAARYKVPTLFYIREQTAAGGLMSYGASFPESFVRPAFTPRAFSKR
jgi:putative tryptophan/tyrosine transport system substrate-binding protein